MAPARKRIDQVLMERGLAGSRQKAQALLLAGQVLVDGQKVEKPGQRIPADAEIRILEGLPYVGRGGLKLQAALEHFAIPVRGRVCADLGASTGGFTDCLLQQGARKVHAFDVGRGQLAWKLRMDPRVAVHDARNVRHITARDLPPDVGLVTIDLSFISLTKVLEPVRAALRDGGAAGTIDFVLLVKPQFEVGKGEVGKGGIVRDPEKARRTVEVVAGHAEALGFEVAGSLPSPVLGAKGNQEFLLYLRLHPGLSSAP
ncbi:MAG: TlyA family RNA methyltransferase [Acidobacteriota bacterium]